ncbi:hypothetical protein VP1G_05528 [Cytospora mali]|uniref:Uncharacterized protein n=1 Tax=Cytospora mali TaxID=578113 RepID=A0A194V2V9_CYTMA|nr:hypothetical protein VP1G_05528 [Valsa mali var. pyri (nom. inval.)]
MDNNINPDGDTSNTLAESVMGITTTTATAAAPPKTEAQQAFSPATMMISPPSGFTTSILRPSDAGTIPLQGNRIDTTSTFSTAVPVSTGSGLDKIHREQEERRRKEATCNDVYEDWAQCLGNCPGLCSENAGQDGVQCDCPRREREQERRRKEETCKEGYDDLTQCLDDCPGLCSESAGQNQVQCGCPRAKEERERRRKEETCEEVYEDLAQCLDNCPGLCSQNAGQVGIQCDCPRAKEWGWKG